MSQKTELKNGSYLCLGVILKGLPPCAYKYILIVVFSTEI